MLPEQRWRPRGAQRLAVDAPDLVRSALLEKRLVLNATDFHTVRLLPPLTVSEEEIDEAVRRIGELVG